MLKSCLLHAHKKCYDMWKLFLLAIILSLLFSSALTTLKCMQSQAQLPSDAIHLIFKNCSADNCFYEDLKSLDLSNNQLKDLSQESFNCLANLEVLNISFNSLENLSSVIFSNLSNLNTLDLSNNQISRFQILTLTNLKFLKLDYNKLQSINRGTFKNLINLRHLDVSSNHIARIQENSFENLKNLTVLYIQNNNLKYLSIDLFKGLLNLVVFNSSNNQITQLLDDTFDFSINIEELNLSNNKLVLLNPGTFKSLTRLRHLDLSNNQLSRLPNDLFSSLNSLEKLLISYNNLTTLRNNTFKNLTNLQHLDLSFNRIFQLQKSTFQKHLANLQVINLCHNQLTEMELWPLYLPKILSVDLKHNLIEKFTNSLGWNFETSSYLPALDSSAIIDLQFNKISLLDDRAIQQYGICSYSDYISFINKYFNNFLLNNNPIECKCSLSQRLVKDSVNLSNKTSIYKSYCSSPSVYIGRSILNFDKCGSMETKYPFCKFEIINILPSTAKPPSKGS